MNFVLRKNHVFVFLQFAWALVAFGGTILVYSGQAEPYVAASRLPEEPMVTFVGALGVVAVGWGAVGAVKRRSWNAMGRRVGLAPERGLLSVGAPTLSGTVGGRAVRVRTRKKSTGGGGESGDGKSTFTIVEADLDEPVDDGFFVGRGDGGGAVEVPHLPATTVDDEFVAVGGDEAMVRAVLTERVRDALRELDDDEALLVGDAGATMADAVAGAIDSGTVGALASMASEQFAGDASTVSYETKGLLLNADELDRRLDAVTGVADAFETAVDDAAR